LQIGRARIGSQPNPLLGGIQDNGHAGFPGFALVVDQGHGGIGLGGDDTATVVGNAGGGGSPYSVETGQAQGLFVRSAHPVQKFGFALVVVFKETIHDDQATLALGRFSKGRLFPQGYRTGVEGLLGQLGGLFTISYPGWDQSPPKESGL